MADSTEAGHVEEMGLGRRMVGVFFSPGATFESVRSRVSTSDWLVPLIDNGDCSSYYRVPGYADGIGTRKGQYGTGRNQYGGYADH